MFPVSLWRTVPGLDPTVVGRRTGRENRHIFLVFCSDLRSSAEARVSDAAGRQGAQLYLCLLLSSNRSPRDCGEEVRVKLPPDCSIDNAVDLDDTESRNNSIQLNLTLSFFSFRL
ncbi:hypothetical protein AOLI_G00202190 [Acnodon oligacanthus]